MAFRQQPDDTYFVEEAFPTQAFQASYHKDRLNPRLVGRVREEELANELSRQACEDYMEEIVGHMNSMECETLPDVASIDIQQEIQWFMRPYLIDFLIESHAAFQLLPETLFLAVNLLDRYCSRRVVYKRHYQLVGCAALLIASKYGDRKERVPMIRELKSMCCSLYDEDMFTQMEWHVLNTLEWMIGHPTVDTWLQLALKDESISGTHYVSGHAEDLEVEHMAWYFSEIALYHKDFVSVKPSVMAQASLALARGVLGRPDDMGENSHEVSAVLLDMSRKLDHPSRVLARKYASPQMSQVSAKLEHFLRRQEEINRCAAPPTPPCDVPIVVTKPQPHVETIYPGTPRKQQLHAQHNGYMTPPITPDAESQYFTNGNAEAKCYLPVPRCPVTPTPTGLNPYVHNYQQQYQQYRPEMVMHG